MSIDLNRDPEESAAEIASDDAVLLKFLEIVMALEDHIDRFTGTYMYDAIGELSGQARLVRDELQNRG